MEYRAFQVSEEPGGTFHRKVVNKKTQDLPDNEVCIRVHFSGLNYKDALSATGHKGITKRYPHTPGIDASGTIETSHDPKLSKGDPVIVTGYDLGMNTPGGFGEYISVPSSWVIPLPENLTLEESMMLGTAGLTAGIALHKMERSGQQPTSGPVLVTGASGGVGSLAIGILKRAGYDVIASTGTSKNHNYLNNLGADEIVDRSHVNDNSNKPLLRPSWAGAIDTVGGNTLATLIKGCQKEGNIAVCGLVDTPLLNTTVYPFILNGINLIGIESATFDHNARKKIWHKLAHEWKIETLDPIVSICSLDEVDEYISQILEGKTRGRIVVDMNR
jgi:acrylyl-CoA reductase (NADPH)